MPAQQGLIKQVVEERLILKAVSYNGTVNQLSKVIGLFIGGSLAAAVSPRLCILINAVAFFVSALIFWRIAKHCDRHAHEDGTKEALQTEEQGDQRDIQHAEAVKQTKTGEQKEGFWTA
jgi:MFS transporter, DHA3 family, macrolide efflux protein